MEKLLHPLYFLDFSPSEYHLFRGLPNHLDGVRLTSREKVVLELVSYFTSKPKEFYIRGIYKLVDRWGEVLGNSEGYVND